MKTIIHDLDTDILKSNAQQIIINQSSTISSCIGCFGCWIKSPAICVIKDEYQNMPEIIRKSEEIILISECNYGSYSPFVKNILDRSIGYILPFFTIKNKEMHHQRRYSSTFKLTVFFYGDVSEAEKETANALVKANALNFWVEDYSVSFLKTKEKAKEHLNEYNIY